jgi:hypothetical protein
MKLGDLHHAMAIPFLCRSDCDRLRPRLLGCVRPVELDGSPTTQGHLAFDPGYAESAPPAGLQVFRAGRQDVQGLRPAAVPAAGAGAERSAFALGEGIDIGMDLGSPIDFTYKLPFRFTGKIEKVTVALK